MRINMLENIKESVALANKGLKKHQLVVLTWGNASEKDPETGNVVIKPSGVDYADMNAADMVVVSIEGAILEGDLRPSSDLETHLEIYRSHPEIGGIVHTHSPYAVAYSQAGRSLKVYGTTHADYFHGEIPCTRVLTQAEILSSYEANIGKVINESLQTNGLLVPGILVRSHGCFTFGKNATEAVYHAIVLEEIAKMNHYTEVIDPNLKEIDQALLDKHYFRKHGMKAYYGQGGNRK